MPQLFLISALAIFAYMVTVFLWATLIKDNSIVDVAWGLGFVVVAATGLLLHPSPTLFQIALMAITACWALRLSSYIYLRNRNTGEDYRYAQWRKDWGKYVVVRAFFQVFMLQGVFMFVIALPIMVVMAAPAAPLLPLSYLGMAIWLIGFLFEAIGDGQKSRFKANPTNKGKIMQRGLWAYTRHPNYFGEALLWWGVFIYAIPAGYWWLSLVSPVVLTFLLTKVSGVAMLEKKYEGNKEFEEYARRTSAFIPWVPRK
ncbi:DUF1295 domain-containing protein [soil metagenome]